MATADIRVASPAVQAQVSTIEAERTSSSRSIKVIAGRACGGRQSIQYDVKALDDSDKANKENNTKQSNFNTQSQHATKKMITKKPNDFKGEYSPALNDYSTQKKSYGQLLDKATEKATRNFLQISTEIFRNASISFKDMQSVRLEKMRQEVERIAAETYNGELVFEIDDIEEKLLQTQNSEIINILSPEFYTSESDGYKLVARVWLNGFYANSDVKDKFVSVTVTVLPHLYDERLEWPYQPKIEVRLLNGKQKTNVGSSIDLKKYGFGYNKPSRSSMGPNCFILRKVTDIATLTKEEFFETKENGKKSVYFHIRVT